MKLLLFDIDSTLVRVARPVTHALTRSIMSNALDYHEELVGFELHGKTDRLILRELCEIAGSDRNDDPDAMVEMERMIVAHWQTHLNDETLELLPGVVPLLDSLASRDDVALAVLTGNLEAGARIKLGIHGLERYFPFGAYGSDSERRIDLPPIALERARAHHGRDFEFAATMIVGDSNRDVECAQAWGIRSLAVATGSLTVDDLRACNPDAVAASLVDRTAIDAFLAD